VSPCNAGCLPDDGPIRPKHVTTNKRENVILTTFLQVLNMIVNDI
jgi:hypothetical protein